ncbi:MAG: preprotein translocase subunit YajC [Verrucomicrobiae bacterium]|nr:preprotein translocase subunit YajC [Verrucomicrobiae bacterium]
MKVEMIDIIMAFAPPPSQGQQQAAPAWASFVPLILLMVVFYFLLIRPQQKKAKAHEEMLKKIKSGDRVLCSGGIIGTVITVKEKTVTVRTADAKIEILKSAVSEIIESGFDEEPPKK